MVGSIEMMTPFGNKPILIGCIIKCGLLHWMTSAHNIKSYYQVMIIETLLLVIRY